MPRFFTKKLLILPRGLMIMAELAIGFFILAAGVVTYGLITLAQGPVDLGFARQTIEEALSNPAAQVQVQIGPVQAEWGGAARPVMLRIKDLQMRQQGRPLMEISDLSVSMATLPLLVGYIRPEHIIVRSPLMTFERSADRSLHFVGAPQPGFTRASAPPATEDLEGFLLDLLRGNTARTGILSHIQEIEIRNARLRMIDHVLGMTWQLTDVTFSFHTVDEGVYGTAVLNLPGQQQFTLQVIYNRKQDLLSFDSNFDKLSLPALAGRILGTNWLRRQQLPLSGSFSFQAQTTPFQVSRFDLTAQAKNGFIFMPQGSRLPISAATVQAGYDDAKKVWTLKKLDITAQKLALHSKGDLAQGLDGQKKGVWEITIPEITLDTLADLWPQDARETPFGIWMTQKIKQWTLKNVLIHVPLETKNAQFDLVDEQTLPHVSFDFSGLEADYHPPLTPITGASGVGVYEDDQLTLNLSGGSIMDLSFAPSVIKISDLQKKGAGHAHLDLRFAGPLKDVLHYITLDPISLGKKMPFDPSAAGGKGDYHVTLSFPTTHDLPASEIDVDVQADLSDISLPGAVKKQTLTGGPYKLSVADGTISLSGAGALGGRPLTLTKWVLPLHPAKGQDGMTATATLETDTDLRTAFGANLPFLKGSVPLTLSYAEKESGDEVLDLSADLTPAEIAFTSLSYQKEMGKSARASAQILIQDHNIQKASNLMLEAPGFKIKEGTLTFGPVQGDWDLTGAILPTFALARSEAALTYKRTGTTQVINVKGHALDLSPFLDAPDDTSEKGSALDLSAAVKNLYLGTTAPPLTGATLRAKITASDDIELLDLTGQAGGGRTSLQYLPNAKGQMTFNLQAADAGSFLRAAGVYDNMQGGSLVLRGNPVGNNNRDVKGTLDIRDFSVVKAPVLAQLISALSLEGIGDQLGNKGISFARLKSKFSWTHSTGHDVMRFSDGRTSGAALGLTFDGLYDRKVKKVDITGTVIPMSELNTFASKIPLIGQILAGGKDKALFAATYSIKGPAAKPSTLVNPLSVLTPGIFRGLLFEDTPDDPSDTPRVRRQTND